MNISNEKSRVNGKIESESTAKGQYCVGEISTILLDNVEYIQDVFSLVHSLTLRFLNIKDEKHNGLIVYLSDLVDDQLLDQEVLNPLFIPRGNREDLGASVEDKSKARLWDDIVQKILHGQTILFIDGEREAYLFETSGGPSRSIEDSVFETTIKGSHVGFVEDANQNIALLRQFNPTHGLKTEEVPVGQQAMNRVSLLYIEGLAQPDHIKELKERVQKVNAGRMINIGQLAEHIEDNHFSPFPQFLLTERPDLASMELLKGKVCVVLDRSPSVLIAPSSIITFFQSVDDYSTRWLVASFVRLLRFLALLIAIFLPAIYIATISFNFDVIPIRLLITIGESRAKVPFDPLIEALIMEITLEMLREAGIRLPTPIGQTVGIVGGIVIGQAAVEAGIVSNFMVIIVSLTAISSFIIPNYDMSLGVRLIRFPMMIIASIFGVVGIAIGLMILIAHVIALDSLGTPYGAPFAPVRYSNWGDSIVRLPSLKLKRADRDKNN
jgi:spore germination protein